MKIFVIDRNSWNNRRSVLGRVQVQEHEDRQAFAIPATTSRDVTVHDRRCYDRRCRQPLDKQTRRT